MHFGKILFTVRKNIFYGAEKNIFRYMKKQMTLREIQNRITEIWNFAYFFVTLNPKYTEQS